jgi:PAS domain S-box-containing protein
MVIEHLFFQGMWQNTRDTMFMILAKDGDFFIDSINPALEAVVGMKSAELKGTRVEDFLPDSHILVARYRDCLTKNSPLYYEEEGIAPDGSVHYFHTMLVPAEHDGHQYVLGASRNIDDIKEAETVLAQAKEAAESANRAKNLFLANMSHELRTPLNGIVGTASLLRAKHPEPEYLEHLELIERSAAAMERLTADILDLSKVENNRLDIELAPCDLREPVRDTILLFQQQAEAKHLGYHWHIDDSLPLQVMADNARIRQILTNLMSNAIKFTDSGEVALKVHFDATEPDQGVVTFVVTDTGVGIPKDQLDKIGIPFYQISPERNRGHEGSGIGLSVCNALTKLMGGNFVADSDTGQGTRTQVRLPVQIVQHTPDRDEMRPPDIPEALNVLVAEDNPANQIIIERMLDYIKAQVVVVNNGHEVLTAMETASFDVILMDINMPGMDGITAAQRLRELGHDIPIIALTAAVVEEERQACFNAGMNDFLAKPVRLDTLRAALQPINTRPVHPTDRPRPSH